jgi:aminoglycoside phosphotransferase (APT) family kinase protein
MSRWTDSTGATAMRVGAQLLRDRLSNPKVTERGQVPTSVEAITPAWWTAVLCDKVPGAEVVSVAAVSGSKGTHHRHRFALTYNDAGKRAGLPEAVFTKSLPTLVTRMIGGYNGTARAEGRFYTQIRPHLAIEAPLGYHAAFDRETLAGVNVLEDIVVTKDATFCNYKTYVTRSMAEEMVDLLAELHGATWNDPRLDTEWKWVAGFADWFRVGSQKMQTEYYTQRSLDKAAHLVPKKVFDRRSDVWPATLAATPIHEQGPRSLLHSDVHIGNWYRTGGGSPRMGLCDWQCLTKGHWSRDVAYMLSAALTPKDRAAWERDLLKRYLERMGARAGTKLAFDESFGHYRRQMLHALWMWTITLCHSPFLPAMQTEDTSLAMIERISAAMADLDSIDAALR